MGEDTIIERLKWWLKQLFCRHNYLADYFYMQDSQYLICEKCGKAKLKSKKGE